MSKSIVWAITHLAVLAVVWAGYIKGIQGAEYLFMFYVWVMCLPIWVVGVMSYEVQDGLSKDIPSRARRNANACINGSVLVVLAWHGSFFTACAWLACIVLSAVAIQAAGILSQRSCRSLERRQLVQAAHRKAERADDRSRS